MRSNLKVAHYPEVFSSASGGSSTPARRAFERPIAIACFLLIGHRVFLAGRGALCSLSAMHHAGHLRHQSTTRGHHGERSQHWRRQQNEQGDQQYFEHDLPSHLISGLCARPSPLRSWTLLFAVSQRHGVGKFTIPELSVLA